MLLSVHTKSTLIMKKKIVKSQRSTRVDIRNSSIDIHTRRKAYLLKMKMTYLNMMKVMIIQMIIFLWLWKIRGTSLKKKKKVKWI